MFKKVDSGFKDRVYNFVSKIPKGKLVTYGQVAEACGIKGAAYQVGQIVHRQALEADGIEVSDEFVVDIDGLRWKP